MRRDNSPVWNSVGSECFAPWWCLGKAPQGVFVVQCHGSSAKGQPGPPGCKV